MDRVAAGRDDRKAARWSVGERIARCRGLARGASALQADGSKRGETRAGGGGGGYVACIADKDLQIVEVVPAVAEVAGDNNVGNGNVGDEGGEGVGAIRCWGYC
ncbi:MAG: hypothetical protein CMJ49_05640 [Planctomycetaceae bacterium]|nr:hypothetical protein [Planctomycetaceae bacterium]